ncbi:hypothetical protein [Asticcacaulis sp. AC402]|uniref:hypothetical protein n=1 Tax=Asticcacaulis sp. AC402 TaxID=1282361 RepID=UPI0003C3DDB8|nr:hypothetical protein ABAC402_01960 [Asticcacaulis sp. AC402]
MDMDPALNVILLIAGVLFTVLAGWLGARPPDLRRPGPRMVPWRFVMLLSAAFTAVMFSILMHHYGLGQPPRQY